MGACTHAYGGRRNACTSSPTSSTAPRVAPGTGCIPAPTYTCSSSRTCGASMQSHGACVCAAGAHHPAKLPRRTTPHRASWPYVHKTGPYAACRQATHVHLMSWRVLHPPPLRTHTAHAHAHLDRQAQLRALVGCMHAGQVQVAGAAGGRRGRHVNPQEAMVGEDDVAALQHVQAQGAGNKPCGRPRQRCVCACVCVCVGSQLGMALHPKPLMSLHLTEHTLCCHAHASYSPAAPSCILVPPPCVGFSRGAPCIDRPSAL